MRLSILFPLLFHFVLSLNAAEKEPTDTLVFKEDLAFDSDFDRINFFSLKESGEHAFEVLMSIDGDYTSEQIKAEKIKLDYTINGYDAVPIPKKKKSKYVKQLYSMVHDRFLTKYELKNYFNDIFSDGNYNCVSGCALYGLVFKEMEIPYVIKETPTHVYMIVNYDGEQILIETTDPVEGFSKLSSNFKTSFVKLLTESKLISETEYHRSTIDDLFDEYYFTKKDLTLTDLVALQYSNAGLYQIDEGNYDKALDALMKSYYLYPSEKTKEILLFVLSNEMTTQEHDDLHGAHLMTLLSRYDEKTVKDTQLEGEFHRLTNNILINNGNYQFYDSAFNYLKTNLNRPEVVMEIEFLYYYERGRILFNKGNYKMAMPYLESAFGIKPQNLNIEALFLGCLGENLATKTDGTEIINILSLMLEKHKMLSKNNKFGGIYLNAHLMLMTEYYDTNRFSEGEYHQKKFEELATSNPDYQYEQSFVGRAYSKLAVYYFRKGHYISARSAINKGLEYAPTNVELQNRKRMMSR